jgi:hypothetical protein
MRRALIAAFCAAVALGGLPGTAPATPAAGGSASCVGIITSAEGSQLPPGSVGQEVSGLARSVPRLGEALVSPLAREHGGNCA